MIGQPMPQDILKYEARFVLGLTTRKCVFYGIGTIFSLFSFFNICNNLDINLRIMISVCICLPFFVWGTVKPFGQNLETIIIPIIIDNFIAPAIRRNEVHDIEYEKETTLYKDKKDKKNRAKTSKEYKMIM